MEGTPKDTLETTEKQNEALIAEMLRDAKVVEIPSQLTREPVIHRGDAELAAPMTVKEISSAGYVWVWDSRSFEKIPILYYMLPSKLRQRRPDGSYRFTTTDPGKQPARGTIKCMLHPDGENRKHYDELGFRVCPKDNMTNNYQMQQHMIKKHPQEWKAIKEEKETKEKDEDRQLQRLLLASQLPKEKEKIAEDAQEIEQVPQIMSDTSFVCEKCNKSFKYKKVWRNHTKVCKQGG